MLKSRRNKKDIDDLRNTQQILVKTIKNHNDTLDYLNEIVIKLADDYRWRVENKKQEIKDMLRNKNDI